MTGEKTMKFYIMDEAGEQERAADEDEAPVDSLVMPGLCLHDPACSKLTVVVESGKITANYLSDDMAVLRLAELATYCADELRRIGGH
jgi:hypothetical protein